MPIAPWDGAIAKFERRLIAERTRDGVAAARAAGRHPGRPKLDQEKLRAALVAQALGFRGQRQGLGRVQIGDAQLQATDSAVQGALWVSQGSGVVEAPQPVDGTGSVGAG